MISGVFGKKHVCTDSIFENPHQTFDFGVAASNGHGVFVSQQGVGVLDREKSV